MTNLDNIDVPDEVVDAAFKSWFNKSSMSAAIRAALKAWVDCGRAKVTRLHMLQKPPAWSVGDWHYDTDVPVLILRLDPIAKEPSND